MSSEYTKYGRELLNELNRQVLTLYSRKDVEFQCMEYKDAFSDERPSIENRLRKVFRARGLDFNDFINANDSHKVEMLKIFPDRERIKADFVKNFYDLFSKIMLSRRFMERLLENYACTEDCRLFADDDTLRVKILKIFVAHSNNVFSEVTSLLKSNAMKTEQKKYDIEDKETVLKCLKDNTFEELFSEQAWLSWLKRRPEYELLKAPQTFNFPEEQRLKIEAGDEIALAESEKQFCDWLSNFYEVVNGEMGTRRDELYKSAKVKLVDYKLSISTASFKERLDFLRNVVANNDFEFQDKLRNRVITVFNLNNTLRSVSDLLDALNGNVRLNADQRRMFARLEAAVQKECILGSSFGLTVKDWTAFFFAQTKNNKPAAPSHDKDYDAVIAYLKQFKSGGTTRGHIVRNAWRIRNNNIFKRADNLANMRMGGLQRSTKRDLYRLVLLLNFHDIGVFESLLADLYTDNVLSETDFVNDSSVLSEGINYKNFAEAVYLYFLANANGKTPAQRLAAAEQMIEETAQHTRDQTQTTTDLTRTYEELFFAILDRAPADFQQSLKENYLVNVPPNMSPMMVAAQTNSAVKTCRKLVETLQSVDGRDLDCGTDILDLLESDSFNDYQKDERFVSLLQNMARSLNVYERNLLNEVGTAEKISRTDAIALFFTYFVNKCLSDLLQKFVNWVDLSHEFTATLDNHLNDCGFMKFNVKLVYDNFILLALFLYVVDEMLI